ncbi:hypothetical protein RSAG8_05777, partial [Rhizoctonia solani AG-8 WAC10335]
MNIKHEVSPVPVISKYFTARSAGEVDQCGRAPKQVQAGKARTRRPTTFRLPAFQDIAALTDVFLDKIVHMLKLVIVQN